MTLVVSTKGILLLCSTK